jgi:hypothetical protein
MKNDPLVKDAQKIKLNDLLDENQTADIWKIMNEQSDPVKRVRALTDYLTKLREHLEGQGFLPEYLAYVIEAQRMYQLGSKLSKKGMTSGQGG